MIHEDNEACITQVQKEFIRTDATKQLDPMHHAWIIQEQGKTLLVNAVRSQENTADIFTKALPKEVHWKHLRGLGLISLKELTITPQSVISKDQPNGLEEKINPN